MKILRNWDQKKIIEFIDYFKKADPHEYEEPPLTNGVAEGFRKEALCHLERYDEFLKPILHPISVFSRRNNLLIYVPFCGPGIETMKLVEECPQVKVIAFDVSKDMINFAKESSQKFSVSCRRRVTFLHESIGNIENLFISRGIPTIIIARRGLHGLKQDEIKKLIRKLCGELPSNGFFYNISFRSDFNKENEEFLLKELKMRCRDANKEFLLNATAFLLAILNAPTFGEYSEIFKYNCADGFFAIRQKPIDIEFLYTKDKTILKWFQREGYKWDCILEV